MRPFLLDEAESVEQALELLSADEDAHLIAGGTSVMVLMNLGLMEPSHLISLRRVSQLRDITTGGDGGLDIQAMTTHRQLETSPEVQRFCPALAATFGEVATVRIRNQGTIGGNLAHADPAQDPPPMLIALDCRGRPEERFTRETRPPRGTLNRVSQYRDPTGRDPD